MEHNKVEWAAFIVIILIGIAYFVFMAVEYVQSQRDRETFEDVLSRELREFFAQYDARTQNIVPAEVVTDES